MCNKNAEDVGWLQGVVSGLWLEDFRCEFAGGFQQLAILRLVDILQFTFCNDLIH